MYLKNTLQVLSRFFSQDAAAAICKAPFGKLPLRQRHFHYHHDQHHQRAVTRNKENCLLHGSFILRYHSYFRTDYIIQNNLHLFRFEAAGPSALCEWVTFRVPEHFAATKICSNQQLLIAIIVEILKGKKLHKYKTVFVRYAQAHLRNAWVLKEAWER